MAAGCGKQEHEEDKGGLSTQADEDSEWMGLTPPELAQETLNARNDPDMQGAQEIEIKTLKGQMEEMTRNMSDLMQMNRQLMEQLGVTEPQKTN